MSRLRKQRTSSPAFQLAASVRLVKLANPALVSLPEECAVTGASPSPVSIPPRIVRNLNIAKKKIKKKILETAKLGKTSQILLEGFDAVARCFFFFFFLRPVVFEVFRESVMETRENSALGLGRGRDGIFFT